MNDKDITNIIHFLSSELDGNCLECGSTMEYKGCEEVKREYGIDFVEEVEIIMKRKYFCPKCQTLRFYRSKDEILKIMNELDKVIEAEQEDD